MNSMKLTLEFSMDNEAFTDAPGFEAARIVRKVAEELLYGNDHGYCRDINGNCVGQWKTKEE